MDRVKPIIALDFPDKQTVLNFLEPFDGESLNLKVGMELFYAAGMDLVRILKAEGHSVFLDLKLHDIPNTVKSSMKVLAQSGVDMVNVHASGGMKMMQAAKEGLIEGAKDDKLPILIAVTQLTSTSQEVMNQQQNIQGSIEDSVLNYAKLTEEAGLEGVVCSPLESQLLKDHLSSNFITVTPGIRLSKVSTDDQHRITTPKEAAINGSSYIVVGRPITHSENPLKAYQQIKADWEAGLIIEKELRERE
ncbi:orotidine-5'-phosphate decarboxylase [Aerococcaceae bacterium WGS1372]